MLAGAPRAGAGSRLKDDAGLICGYLVLYEGQIRTLAWSEMEVALDNADGFVWLST